MTKDNSSSDFQILNEIRFGFIKPYNVAGMGEPWVAKLERTFQILKENNIRAILTLTEDNLYGKDYKKADFSHLHEPIDDYEAPTYDGINRAISFIDSSIEKGMGVAVHCAEGRGRTGTVLGAWLGKKENLAPEDAIKKLYDLRMHTVLSPSQRKFLMEYL